MSNFDREECREWLRRNTKLADSSITRYMDIYRLFYEEYKVGTIDNLKEFISKKNRDHNEMHHKAPWFYFFQFKGKSIEEAKALYAQLPKLRHNPLKRAGTYVPDEILYPMLQSIPDPMHRDVSMLRYHVGIRIAEALTIREELISKENTKMLKILIQTKGGRNRAIFLSSEIAKPIIQPYLRERPGFLFLPRFFDSLSPEALLSKVDSEKRRYNESLEEVAKLWGLNKRFSSHDIRRAFAERCRKELKDVSIVQRLMGHKRIENTIRYFEQNPADVLEASARMQGVTNDTTRI